MREQVEQRTEANTKESETARPGVFNGGKGVRRGAGVPRRQRKPLTFVRKRINENINVAAGAAEC